MNTLSEDVVHLILLFINDIDLRLVSKKYKNVHDLNWSCYDATNDLIYCTEQGYLHSFKYIMEFIQDRDLPYHIGELMLSNVIRLGNIDFTKYLISLGAILDISFMNDPYDWDGYSRIPISVYLRLILKGQKYTSDIEECMKIACGDLIKYYNLIETYKPKGKFELREYDGTE